MSYLVLDIIGDESFTVSARHDNLLIQRKDFARSPAIRTPVGGHNDGLSDGSF
jgi:hypothetical protein